jgi:hypothetical protein
MAALAACAEPLDPVDPVDPDEDGQLEDVAHPAVGPLAVHAHGRRFERTVAGIHVLSYAKGGDLIARTVTDASGDAAIAAHRGGAITVVEVAARRITTIFKVAPGDALFVGDVGGWDSDFAHTSITVPALPPGENAKVEGPCVLSSFFEVPLIDALVFGGCQMTTRPILASRSLVDPPYTLTAYLFDPSVAVVPGGSAALDGAWAPAVPFHLSLTGVPSEWVDFSLHRTLGGERIYLFQTGTAFAADHALDITYPQALAGDGTTTKVGISFPDLPGGHVTILEHVTTAATSHTADVSDDFFVRPVDVSLAIGDHGPTGASWQLEGTDDADGVVSQIYVYGEEHQTAWTAIVPPRREQFHLPRLPADLRALWEDQEIGSFYLMTVDTPAPSYRVFRRDAEPELPWEWMRAPLAPGKVRIGT